LVGFIRLEASLRFHACKYTPISKPHNPLSAQNRGSPTGS